MMSQSQLIQLALKQRNLRRDFDSVNNMDDMNRLICTPLPSELDYLDINNINPSPFMPPEQLNFESAADNHINALPLIFPLESIFAQTGLSLFSPVEEEQVEEFEIESSDKWENETDSSMSPG